MANGKRHAKFHGSGDHDTTVETIGHATKHEAAGADEVEFLKLTDRKHAAEHQNGGDDEIDLSGLSGQQIIVPKNALLATITHPDTNKHTLDLATALGETRKIIAVSLNSERTGGTGNFWVYPNEGARRDLIQWGGPGQPVTIADGLQRLQYYLSVANDTFELYCLSYIVEA